MMESKQPEQNMQDKAIREFEIEFRKLVEEIVESYQLADEALTKAATVSAIVQAFKSGDFQKHVRIIGNGMNVIYIPYAETEKLKAENKFLRDTLKALGYNIEECL